MLPAFNAYIKERCEIILIKFVLGFASWVMHQYVLFLFRGIDQAVKVSMFQYLKLHVIVAPKFYNYKQITCIYDNHRSQTNLKYREEMTVLCRFYCM